MEVLTLRNRLLGHSFVFRLSVLLFTIKYNFPYDFFCFLFSFYISPASSTLAATPPSVASNAPANVWRVFFTPAVIK